MEKSPDHHPNWLSESLETKKMDSLCSYLLIKATNVRHYQIEEFRGGYVSFFGANSFITLAHPLSFRYDPKREILTFGIEFVQ
jgi:hypothetical protein